VRGDRQGEGVEAGGKRGVRGRCAVGGGGKEGEGGGGWGRDRLTKRPRGEAESGKGGVNGGAKEVKVGL